MQSKLREYNMRTEELPSERFQDFLERVSAALDRICLRTQWSRWYLGSSFKGPTKELAVHELYSMLTARRSGGPGKGSFPSLWLYVSQAVTGIVTH